MPLFNIFGMESNKGTKEEEKKDKLRPLKNLQDEEVTLLRGYRRLDPQAPISHWVTDAEYDFLVICSDYRKKEHEKATKEKQQSGDKRPRMDEGSGKDKKADPNKGSPPRNETAANTIAQKGGPKEGTGGGPTGTPPLGDPSYHVWTPPKHGPVPAGPVLFNGSFDNRAIGPDGKRYGPNLYDPDLHKLTREAFLRVFGRGKMFWDNRVGIVEPSRRKTPVRSEEVFIHGYPVQAWSYAAGSKGPSHCVYRFVCATRDHMEQFLGDHKSRMANLKPMLKYPDDTFHLEYSFNLYCASVCIRRGWEFMHDALAPRTVGLERCRLVYKEDHRGNGKYLPEGGNVEIDPYKAARRRRRG